MKKVSLALLATLTIFSESHGTVHKESGRTKCVLINLRNLYIKEEKEYYKLRKQSIEREENLKAMAQSLTNFNLEEQKTNESLKAFNEFFHDTHKMIIEEKRKSSNLTMLNKAMFIWKNAFDQLHQKKRKIEIAKKEIETSIKMMKKNRIQEMEKLKKVTIEMYEAGYVYKYIFFQTEKDHPNEEVRKAVNNYLHAWNQLYGIGIRLYRHIEITNLSCELIENYYKMKYTLQSTYEHFMKHKKGGIDEEYKQHLLVLKNIP